MDAVPSAPPSDVPPARGASAPTDDLERLERDLSRATRELQILQRLPRGESNREIGLALAISESTVKNLVASILAKLHLDESCS